MILSLILPCNKLDTEAHFCISKISYILKDCAYELILITTDLYYLKFTQKYPSVVVIKESSKGIYSAMNDGIKVATGNYLYFIGKDDVILDEFIFAFKYIKKYAPTVLSCDVVYKNSGIYSGFPSKFKLLYKNLCHQGLFYHKSCFSDFGLFATYMKVQADHFHNVKLLWSNKCDVHYLNKKICVYSNSGFSSFTSDIIFHKLYPLILKKYVGNWAFILILIFRFFK